MTSFITRFPNPVSDQLPMTVVIDGSAQEAKNLMTEFYDGERAVQLRKARTEESTFDWGDRRITAVVAKEVVIYDDIDIRCLRWFIAAEKTIDFSKAFLSPDALGMFISMCEELGEMKMKVKVGSSIHMPYPRRYTEGQLNIDANRAAEAIGFKIC